MCLETLHYHQLYYNPLLYTPIGSSRNGNSSPRALRHVAYIPSRLECPQLTASGSSPPPIYVLSYLNILFIFEYFTQVLLVDEVSMLAAEFIDLLDLQVPPRYY